MVMGCYVLCAAWLVCDTQLVMLLWRLERPQLDMNILYPMGVQSDIRILNYQYFQLHLAECVTSCAET